MSEYKRVSCPKDHPRYKNNGKRQRIGEHILIAEKKIGRYLKDNEVVHHIDENKRNNNPNNLMVFKNNSYHTSFHDGAKLIQLNNGTYITERKTITVKTENNKRGVKVICPVCNKNYMNNSSSMCRECYIKSNKDFNYGIPEKEQLINNFVENDSNKSRVAKIYNVSQKAVNNWCKKYGIRNCLININMSKPTKERERK